MKPPGVVALIVMGALLILTPVGADYLYQRNAVTLMMANPANNTAILATMSDLYRVVCWLTGTLMIFVAVLVGTIDTRQSFYASTDDDQDEEEK